MNLQTAINLTNQSGVSILLENIELRHQSEGVGTLLVLAIADSLKDATSSKMRFDYTVEANSEIDMERFTLNGSLGVDLGLFEAYDALQSHISNQVVNDLIGQAIAYERASTDVENAFLDWKNSNMAQPFNFEAPDSFNIIDLAADTAKTICQKIEKYWALNSGYAE